MQEKYGNKTINSTSKMINTNATKKKCNLNFTRKSLYVLNPHSKGLCNSRSQIDFLESAFPNIRNRKDKAALTEIKTIQK